MDSPVESAALRFAAEVAVATTGGNVRYEPYPLLSTTARLDRTTAPRALLAPAVGPRLAELVTALITLEVVPTLAITPLHAHALVAEGHYDVFVVLPDAKQTWTPDELNDVIDSVPPERVLRGDDVTSELSVSPASWPTLLARAVQAFVPRAMRATVVWSGLTIDAQRYVANWHDEPVTLSPVQFRLLSMLAAAQGAVVSRRDLATRLFGVHLPMDAERLDAQVRRVRRQLEAAGAEAPVIITARGQGWRLADPERAVCELVDLVAATSAIPIPRVGQSAIS